MEKVDDLTKLKIELYIDDGVIEELEDKITRNFGVLGSEQSERASQMFHQINIALYNIANGINVDISNHISANHFFYDVCPHNDVICSILFDAYAINKHTPAFIVNRIVWKYHNLDWWKIVENKYINTKHNMKSLTLYINESNNKTGKPGKDGKYHFFIHADITLNMDKRGNCDIAVEAQDFEEAKEEAIEIANERLERFPMEWGDVNTATILWDATNNGKTDWGSEQIIG